MTMLLNQAVRRIESLPEPKQDQLAVLLLRQIDEDQQWTGAAAAALARAYAEDEPEYGESDIARRARAMSSSRPCHKPMAG